MDVDSLKQMLEQRMDWQDQTLQRIETQTTKTNGRVTLLERGAAVQAAVLGAVVVIVVATIAVLTFLGMIRPFNPNEHITNKPPEVAR